MHKVDGLEVARILVDRVKRQYADDIAIVAYYGSYAHGTARHNSDLDIFFIPATPQGAAASFQFILDGIGYDFWPISWERAERIASFEEAIVSVIADSKLLYSRSDADLDRFDKLKNQICSLRQPSNRATMLSNRWECKVS